MTAAEQTDNTQITLLLINPDPEKLKDPEFRDVHVVLNVPKERLTEVSDILGTHLPSINGVMQGDPDSDRHVVQIIDKQLDIVNALTRAGFIPREKEEMDPEEIKTASEIRAEMAAIGLPTFGFSLMLAKNSRSNSPQQIAYRMGDTVPPALVADPNLTLNFTVTEENFSAACEAIGLEPQDVPEGGYDGEMVAIAHENHAERLAKLLASGFIDQAAADRATDALANSEVMLIISNPETGRNIYPRFTVHQSRLAELENLLRTPLPVPESEESKPKTQFDKPKLLVDLTEGAIAEDTLNPRHRVRVNARYEEVITALENPAGDGSRPGFISAEQATDIRSQLPSLNEPITTKNVVGSIPRTGAQKAQ